MSLLSRMTGEVQVQPKADCDNCNNQVRAHNPSPNIWTSLDSYSSFHSVILRCMVTRRHIASDGGKEIGGWRIRAVRSV